MESKIWCYLWKTVLTQSPAYLCFFLIVYFFTAIIREHQLFTAIRSWTRFLYPTNSGVVGVRFTVEEHRLHWVTLYSRVFIGRFVQTTEDIMEKNTAGLSVNIVTVASLPELPQVIRIFHYLLTQKHIWGQVVFTLLSFRATRAKGRIGHETSFVMWITAACLSRTNHGDKADDETHCGLSGLMT